MNQNWQTKTLIIGAIIGAVTGIVAATVLIQSATKIGTRPQLTSGDGVKVGLGVLAVLKLLSDLGTR